MDERWPALPLAEWQNSKDTLHLYLQIVGKTRMVLTPPEPQWAHVTLYVTSRGLTTSPIPYNRQTFQVDVDFVSHTLVVNRSNGATGTLELRARTVASFYEEYMSLLRGLNISVQFTTVPQEVASQIPFEKDTEHTSYDRTFVERFFRILSSVDVLLKKHRAPYRGRHTPVHLFWGGLDLAYNRYTGNRTQPPPGAPYLYRTSMDAEEIYVGWWPGDARFPEPAFACYVYPRPPDIEQRKLRPPAAFWDEKLGNFIFRYEDARNATSPEEAILDFFTSSYEECASCAGWDRTKLG